MKVFFVSLGCDKNLVDSEVMLGSLTKNNYIITNNEQDADIIVVNTCGFINDAKEESINTILEMAEYKKYAKCKVLIVTGCLAQRYQEELIKEIEEIDAILGTSSYDDIILAIQKVIKGQKFKSFKDIHNSPFEMENRVLTTGGYYAYLKIAEGCDNHCTYCIIPKLRGRYRSRSMENILHEASYLVQKGVKEIILVAQDTTIYGHDIYNKKMLPELLKKLSMIEGIMWIRLLYCYPEEITQELLEVIKNNDKVCNYLDIPIQHCNDVILKKMARKTNKETILEKIKLIRQIIPNCAIRTTIITGFPSETNEQHQELLEFIKQIQFDRLGVFIYSQEENTKAASMHNQVEDSIKMKRKEEIMLAQQSISKEKSLNMIGKELDILIEGFLPDEKIYVGRSYRDAPEVDGYVFINIPNEIISGTFVKAKIIESDEYDLIGEIMNEFS